jgi:hypothetical protein
MMRETRASEPDDVPMSLESHISRVTHRCASQLMLKTGA